LQQFGDFIAKSTKKAAQNADKVAYAAFFTVGILPSISRKHGQN
jgi:hypothetical protein